MASFHVVLDLPQSIIDLQLLAEGGFSQVFSAQQGSSSKGVKRAVCVKEVALEIPGQSFANKRFLLLQLWLNGHVKRPLKLLESLPHSRKITREISLLEKLKGKNTFIIDYIQSFVSIKRKSVLILTELCVTDLRQFPVRWSFFPKALEEYMTLAYPAHLILHLLVPIFLAVQYLHSCNILHMDLKQENVFLTNRGVPKLGDFGAAEILSSGQTRIAFEDSLGTATEFYEAPELVRGEAFSSKADCWTLGILLLHMYRGRQPYVTCHAGWTQVQRLILKSDWEKDEEMGNRELYVMTFRLYDKLPSEEHLFKVVPKEAFVELACRFLRWDPEQRADLTTVLKYNTISPVSNDWQVFMDGNLSKTSSLFQENMSEILLRLGTPEGTELPYKTQPVKQWMMY